jgi:hypothetical protein
MKNVFKGGEKILLGGRKTMHRTNIAVRILAAALFAAPMVLAKAQFAAAEQEELYLWYSSERGDNFSTTYQGHADAVAANYKDVRLEVCIDNQQVAGRVPLKLYWSPERGDNFTTATAEGARDAEAAGYQFVRIEGYVYPTQRPGTIPLKLYWSAERGDNFTTATAEGARDAEAAGYQFVRIEGYGDYCLY